MARLTKRSRMTAAASSFAALALAVTALTTVGGASSEAAVPGNLVINGGFESGVTGWHTAASSQLLTITAAGRSGKAAKLSTSVAQPVTLDDTISTIRPTPAGVTYLLSVWVKSNKPGTAGVLLARHSLSPHVRVTKQSFAATGTWTRVQVPVENRGGGSQLDVRVRATKLEVGETLLVDDVRLAVVAPTLTPTPTASSPTPTPTTATPTPSEASQPVSSPSATAVLESTSPTTVPAPTSSGVPAMWQLQYATDFSDLGGWTVYNNQTQNNDNSINLARNVTAGPHGMRILGQRESGFSRPFTSGEIVGKGAQVVPNYFRAEVTGRFTDASGIWPCLLWFRPEAGGDGSNGEIDVMEWMGGMWTGNQKRVAITMHNEYGATQDSYKAPLTLAANPWFDPNAEHTYTVEKVPGSITVWVDAHKISTFTAANKAWWNRIMEAPDRTWYPRITLQIGQGSVTKVVPNPSSDWNTTDMTVRSFSLWTL